MKMQTASCTFVLSDGSFYKMIFNINSNNDINSCRFISIKIQN